MKRLNNVVALVDPADDMEAFARLTWSQEQLERQAERREEHRREKRDRKICRLLNVCIILESIALVLVIFWNL